MTYQDIADLSARIPITVPHDSFESRFVRNPNHHLWNNRGTWWCHFTVHHPDYTAERVRCSLRTSDVNEARCRRDELLETLAP